MNTEPEPQATHVAGYIACFAAIYSSILIAAGLLVAFVGIKIPNAALIIASVVFVFSIFLKREDRGFTNSERRQLVFGSFVIDIIIQSALLFLISPSTGSEVSTLLLLGILAGVELLHLLLIAFSYYYLCNMILKNHLQSADKKKNK